MVVSSTRCAQCPPFLSAAFSPYYAKGLRFLAPFPAWGGVHLIITHDAHASAQAPLVAPRLG
jgi:hypothetical protein